MSVYRHGGGLQSKLQLHGERVYRHGGGGSSGNCSCMVSVYRHGGQQRNVQLLVHDSHSVIQQQQQQQQNTNTCCCNMCVCGCVQVWVRAWRIGPDGCAPHVLNVLRQCLCHSKLKVSLPAYQGSNRPDITVSIPD